jgi:hypothetical protein
LTLNLMQVLQLRHTVSPQFVDETYHIAAIRTSLNRNIDDILPDLIDEMILAFQEILESQMVKEGSLFAT